MNINRQILIAAILVAMAVTVGIPAVETEFAQASMNNLDNCGSGESGGWGSCGGSGGWDNGSGS